MMGILGLTYELYNFYQQKQFNTFLYFREVSEKGFFQTRALSVGYCAVCTVS